MFFKSIDLINFRNYDRLSLKLHPNINIIIGKNGQGKTNILESLYYFAYLKSHRSLDDNFLIMNGKNSFKLKCKIKRESFFDEIKIDYNLNKRTLFFNGSEIAKKSEFLKIVNVILFEPSNLEIIKGSPNNRREYLNDAISQINDNYYNILNDYNKLLKMRNEFLKSHRNDKEYLEALDKYFIDKAIIIYQMRAKYVNRINEFINQIFENIMGSKSLKIVYKSFYENTVDKSNIKEELIAKMKQNFYKEKENGLTLEGPHKDDFIFMLNDINLKEYGSQGQQRAAVISLKLSEAEIIKKYNQQNPILLLDDIFSELDGIRKNKLLKYLNNDQQVILTTTDITKIAKKIIINANIIKIEQGKVV